MVGVNDLSKCFRAGHAIVTSCWWDHVDWQIVQTLKDKVLYLWDLGSVLNCWLLQLISSTWLSVHVNGWWGGKFCASRVVILKLETQTMEQITIHVSYTVPVFSKVHITEVWVLHIPRWNWKKQFLILITMLSGPHKPGVFCLHRQVEEQWAWLTEQTEQTALIFCGIFLYDL